MKYATYLSHFIDSQVCGHGVAIKPENYLYHWIRERLRLCTAFNFVSTPLGGATIKCWIWKYSQIGFFALRGDAIQRSRWNLVQKSTPLVHGLKPNLSLIRECCGYGSPKLQNLGLPISCEFCNYPALLAVSSDNSLSILLKTSLSYFSIRLSRIICSYMHCDTVSVPTNLSRLAECRGIIYIRLFATKAD